MNWLSIGIMIIVIGLTTWLLVDTIILFVRKYKAKKAKKQEDQITNHSNEQER